MVVKIFQTFYDRGHALIIKNQPKKGVYMMTQKENDRSKYISQNHLLTVDIKLQRATHIDPHTRANLRARLQQFHNGSLRLLI